MIFYILRGGFVILSAAVALLYVLPFQEEQQVEFGKVVAMVGLTLGVTLCIIAADIFVRRKGLAAISGLFLGLVAGLIVAYALSFVVDLVGVLVPPPEGVAPEGFQNLLKGVKVLIGLTTCYLGCSFVIQTKDDFRFVIPYVEFAKEIRGHRPTLVDTSTIIDGRIVDILNTHILQGTLIVPRFVLNELQAVADAPDRLKRAKGRRGLEVLHALQNSPIMDVVIEDADAEGGTVDQKLVSLAQHLNAKLMTNDFNLNQVAKVRGVDVINLNELAKSLRPVFLPGETMQVKVVKGGETPAQGVGYREDGTMVVVENARHLMGQEVRLIVTSTLQTSAGRMIFGRRTDWEEPGTPKQEEGGEDEAAGQDAPRAAPSHASARNPRRNR